ncbi:MAG TPA: uroporphyrinogen decarboxylase family protein [Dictyoglomaceae bacterium]|nr:uroporphyrinogen decarboxylase family protein [Dictyoglomaceae bacterium]HOL39026.1 uroporphyrinogen decarboxylase family protein [Dictyoglomaceae bacterium]HPP15798.1 uroporphyrinogen decarboxylase family protein [Dictyoglomaceae bacterium]
MEQKKKRLVIPLLSAPGVKLSNTTLKENLADSNIQFKTLSLLLDRFHPDGIFPFMDLTIEAEALGLKIDFPENENPSVREHPVKNKEILEEVKRRWNGISGRMEIFIRLAERMVKEFDVLKGSYVIGPFTLAGELMGVTDLGIGVIERPDFVKEIVEFSFKVVKEYAKGLLETGIDMIAVLEPTAVVLSPSYFREFALPYFIRLVDELKKSIIYHICGDTTHLMEDIARSKAYGLSLDSAVDLKWVSEKIPNNMYIIGNLDPVKVFLRGNKELIEKSTRELLEKMEGVDNFILSSGCDIPIGTPLENIEIFMRIARKG